MRPHAGAADWRLLLLLCWLYCLQEKKKKNYLRRRGYYLFYSVKKEKGVCLNGTLDHVVLLVQQ